MAAEVGSPEAVSTRAELGRELTLLRTRAGLSVRQLARQLDTPVATVGDYFSGRHLPGPGQVGVFRRLLAACSVDDPDEVEGWLEALGRARRASDRRSGRARAPYPGLAAFGEGDAGRFFGRETAVAEVVALLERCSAPGEAVAALVGASGAGKSSLLRAGVAPAVRAGALASAAPGDGGGWSVAVCTPGDDPLGALEAAVEDLAEPWLLVVDQLEELFAPSVAGDTRSAFLDRVVSSSGPSRRVLVGLRADFYQDASRQPTLFPVLGRRQLLIGPMTEEELRRAIVEPSRQVGVAIEDGLVERLLADLAFRGAGELAAREAAAHGAGALPLLSHALLATWQRASSNELTLAAYRDSGGLRGAIRQSAEQLFVGLDPAEQALARRLFLRLVHVADDVPLTRRRVRRQELAELDAATPGASVDGLLERFIGARLVTTSDEAVEISHESVLDAWPRLAGWVADDRAGLQLQRQLSEAARSWAAAGRDEALLLRGSRLELACDWLAEADRRSLLNRTEVDLVEASVAQRSAEEATRRRRTRRMQQLVAAAAALALAAGGLAAYAFQSRAEATAARDQALSRQLAIESGQLEATEPSLAAQLALAGYRISPTVQARSRLLDVTAGELPTRLVGPTGPEFVSTAPGAGLLVVAHSTDDRVVLYRLRRGAPRRVATVAAGSPADQVFTASLGAGGRLLAAGGTGHRVVLFGLSDPGRPRRLATLGGFTSTVYVVAFARHGHELAAADHDGTVRIWDLRGPSHRPVLERVLRSPEGTSLKALAVSASGQFVAAGGSGGTLCVWRPGRRRPEVISTDRSSVVEALALSRSGRRLVAAGADGELQVYDVGGSGGTRRARPPVRVTSGIVYSVAFSPDGRTLAAGDADGTLRFFSARSFAPAGSLHEANPVVSLAYDHRGRLVAGGGTGVLRLWPVPPTSSARAPGNVYFLEFPKTDRRRVFVVSGQSHGDVGAWDLAGGNRPRLVGSIRPPAGFGPVDGSGAVSPDGRLVAVANRAGAVRLFDIADVDRAEPVGPVLHGDTPLVEDMAFSPDGQVLAASDDGGDIHRWDVADPSHPKALPTLTGPTSEVLGIAYSPNGHLLAAASADAHVWLYGVAHARRPRRLAKLGGFGSYAFSAAFTPDGRTLVAGSGDGTVRLWDVSHPSRPRRWGSPLAGPAAYEFQVAVSPDGRTLAGATTGGKVWLWDIADRAHPRLRATLRAASGSLFAVAFTPSGRNLLASGTDRVLHRWTVSPARAAARVCRVTGTSITRSEWTLYAPGARYRPPCHR